MSYQPPSVPQKPTAAFVGASWVALGLGIASFAVGLWNSHMTKSEVGFYAATLLLGLFGALSLQKSVRDRAEGVPVTNLYLGVAGIIVGLSIVMMTIGLWNSGLALSERGFYGLAFAMSLFAVVAVQKNVRDSAPPAATRPAVVSPYPDGR
ncbi:inner membrane protein YiaA [Actinoplanes sp. SE50/110]|uniref:inner membrane protein YiaA n=1 Tax=Actinoplanes sp. (strain ATCC 31044 / CBS 674.73 / SE50/110) TaxID=134676 RepID=UPI0003089EB4|nr:inner membrane protein YiaA [Actinoplanes sp. SE50/110]